MNFQSVMERPERVSRVIPPRMISVDTHPVHAPSHTATCFLWPAVRPLATASYTSCRHQLWLQCFASSSVHSSNQHCSSAIRMEQRFVPLEQLWTCVLRSGCRELAWLLGALAALVVPKLQDILLS